MERNQPYIDYPLQRTRFDIPVGDLLDLEADEREAFIRAFLTALSIEITQGSMALKRRVTFKQEIADYRKVIRLPVDYYLLTDEKSKKRNVLAVGVPGQTHTYRSRTHMWQMVTKQGALADLISAQDDALLKRLTKLFDPNNKGKAGFRKEDDLVPPTIYRYLQMNYSVGAAFPPFHARLLVSRFLPKQGKAIVVDPCAGWGGRMLGTLCAKRADEIRYIGIDPAKRNQDAYEELRGLYFKYLSRENKAERKADLFYRPFEQWVVSRSAKSLYGKVDLVFTSPPYFDAENYEAANKRQSANAFKTYEEWREGFYIPFIRGAFELLKVGGYFILNVADTASAPHLERDARLIARTLGFSDAGFFKLAMPSAPGTKGKAKHQVTVNGKPFKYEPVFVFEKKTDRDTKALNFTFPVGVVSAKRSENKVKTGAMKRLAWQDIRTLYKQYDKACNDSFKRIKQNDSPKIVFSNESPVAGFVVNTRSAAGHECLYRGKGRSIPSIAYRKGDTEVTKFSVFSTAKANKTKIVEALRALSQPCIVEVNAEAKTEASILCNAGFEWVDASVNSFGDIYHIYIDKETAESRRLGVAPVERVGIQRLHSEQFVSLAEKIGRRLKRLSPEFSIHPSNYNVKDSWSALALRGYLPDPAYIESLEETAAYQQRENDAWLKKFKKSQIGLQNTPLMAQFPEVQKILDAIAPGASKNGNSAFKRVRFMRLAPKEGELERHTDLTDRTLGLEDGKTVRLHVPIRTNDKVQVTSWGFDNAPTVVNMAQGDLWYLNIRLPHKVINGGDEERIHLVIDVVANERLRSLIAEASTAKPLQVKAQKRSESLQRTQSADAKHYLSLVADWHDPHPAPEIETHEGFHVVRDDLLQYGSKMRFIDYMVRTATEKEFVFGGSNKVGWGAISLAAVCKRYKKKAVFFMAKTNNPTWHQQKVERLGGRIEWVPNGMLNVTLARARAYAEADPKKRRLLPIGLEDPTVIGSIIKVAQGLSVNPKEVWTVASSGTLTRGLQLAFPKAKFFAVQTGHTLTEESAGRAEVLVSPYKYDKPVKAGDAPPYPSESFYDAKLWSFVRTQGKKGALIWNVA